MRRPDDLIQYHLDHPEDFGPGPHELAKWIEYMEETEAAAVDAADKIIASLGDDDDDEPICKYKTCPEEMQEFERKTKWLDWVAGLSHGLMGVAVVWLLWQQYVIWEATK